MTIRLYNTVTRQKEDFVPLDPAGRKVFFYNCGPTVYAPFHIGNARNFVLMDVVRRWLVHRGYDVFYAQNITDVDDKIIDRARQENRSPEAVAETYTRVFLEHLALLGNLPASSHPKATNYIPAMIEDIASLIETGHAYPTADGSVWYHVASFADYGKLSRRPLDQMEQGERVSEDQQSLKKSPMDFALWKGAKPGEPAWETPWGKGRPGWHIECSCMASRLVQAEHGRPTLDIHAGGLDLQFPHHENEIAQAEAISGKPFAKYWLHNGFLNIDGEKMSKSLGNFLRIDEVLERMDALSVRFFLISSHYRAPQDMTDDALEAAKNGVGRILNAEREARLLFEQYPEGSPRPGSPADDMVKLLGSEFDSAMDDDFNTPQAIAVIFKVVRQILDAVRMTQLEFLEDSELYRAKLFFLLSELTRMRKVLGLTADLEPKAQALGSDGLTEDLLNILIETRAEARKAKQFALGDLIRDRLAAAGIALEDRPGATTVWKHTGKR